MVKEISRYHYAYAYVVRVISRYYLHENKPIKTIYMFSLYIAIRITKSIGQVKEVLIGYYNQKPLLKKKH